MKQKTAKKKITVSRKQNLTGWAFLLPTVILIVFVSFYPIFKALYLSFRTGTGANTTFAELYNYRRMFKDEVFKQSIKNNFIYLIIQVPIMLMLAIMLAVMLNKKDLRFKGLFRTCVFLPCAISSVSYSLIFRSMFSLDGLINTALMNLNILNRPINWLGAPNTARIVMIIALIWRWTGYNTVFYLAGLQNIDDSLYESAMIDGANGTQRFRYITMPLLSPMILLTTITSINGTLQLFDESVNLTNGGPANATITMSHYIYKMSFEYSPNFGYASAMSFLILVLIGGLSFIQLKVGDKR